MRAFFLVLAPLILAGCNSLARDSGDNFEAAGVPPDQFEQDTNACQTQADNYLAYDPRGMEGTRYARNRAFNAIFDRCMRTRGYRARPYYKNLLPG